MERLIGDLVADMGLGRLTAQPVRVSGGYMHRMYRARTDQGEYAVKHLNPEIMKRPDAMDNYRRAEALEGRLEEAGLPIVPALTHQGSKMQQRQGSCFYVFPWVEGQVLGWREITAEHCRVIGDLLAQVHSVERREEPFRRDEIRVDWDALIVAAQTCAPEIAPALRENRETLYAAQKAFNRALNCLPPVTCISDADMDSKNVLWQNSKPLVIDLECLDWGHPLWDMFQLAMSWSGGVLCELDGERLRAFVSAYAARYGEIGMEWADLYAAGFAWLEWLEYNVRRAIGEASQDEEERRLGAKEALETIQRIGYHARIRENALRVLREI